MAITIQAPPTAQAISRLGVVRSSASFSVIALAPIAAGERILELSGIQSERPTRTSVQVGDGVHIDLPPSPDLERDLDRYLWRFLNHSCDPNASWRGLELVALTAIAAWQEICFDYNTSELEIASPFVCTCASPGCRRDWVRGFAHLDLAEQTRLAPQIAPHLRRWREAAQHRPRTG